MRRFTAIILTAGLATSLLAGCGGTAGSTENAGENSVSREDSVIVAMGSTSEPEAGFDPAFGWGAGEHVHEPLIQSTLTVTNPI